MKITAIAFTIVALFFSTALGQETTGGGRRSERNRGPDLPSLGSLTSDLSGVVLQTDTTRNAIQIRAKQNQREREFGLLLDPKCKIKADKKEFGKKQLTLEEIQPGYEVKMLVRRADMRIIEMKVKKPKEAPPNG